MLYFNEYHYRPRALAELPQKGNVLHSVLELSHRLKEEARMHQSHDHSGDANHPKAFQSALLPRENDR